MRPHADRPLAAYLILVAVLSGAFIAGMVAGSLIWFAWHVPLVFVMPAPEGFTVWQQALNAAILAAGSVATFVFLAWIFARSGSIWVASFAHAVFNNGARSFSYFVTIDHQLAANAGLAATMLAVVGLLWRRGEFAVFERFLAERS